MRKTLLFYFATLLLCGGGIFLALQQGSRLETARAAGIPATAETGAGAPGGAIDNLRLISVARAEASLGILSPRIFTMMVIMVIVTTFATSPLLSLSDRWRERSSADGDGERVVVQRNQRS